MSKNKRVLDYVPVFDMARLLDNDEQAFANFAKNEFGPMTSANGFCRWALTPEIEKLEQAHFDKAQKFHALPEDVRLMQNLRCLGYGQQPRLVLHLRLQCERVQFQMGAHIAQQMCETRELH